MFGHGFYKLLLSENIPEKRWSSLVNLLKNETYDDESQWELQTITDQDMIRLLSPINS